MKQPVLLYDGECRYCVEWADRLRSMDPDHAIALVAAAERDRLPGVPFIEPDALDRAIHLVLPDGRVLVGADAVVAVLRRLPRWRWLAGAFRIPGVGLLADRVYRWTAARRHRLR